MTAIWALGLREVGGDGKRARGSDETQYECKCVVSAALPFRHPTRLRGLRLQVILKGNF